MFAALVMVLVGFSALVTAARAATTDTKPFSTGVTSAAYSPSFAVASLPKGGVLAQSLGMFRRWDGTLLPYQALNQSLGNWPYLVNETGTSLRVTRLGQSFTQTIVPGASYSFGANRIKETIKVSSPFPVSFRTPSLRVGLSASYYVSIRGTTVTLSSSSGPEWTSAPFVAWDSANPAHTWTDLAKSVDYAGDSLVIDLDASALSAATYPLYVDPTWVLVANAQNGWPGTVDNVTSDWGDRNLRIGLLADNFNDNTNDIWTVVSGNSFSLSGGAAHLMATHIRATGTWYNVSLESTLNFASCGDADMAFRYSSSSNYYYLYVNFAAQKVTLYKIVAGVQTALSSTLSIPMSAQTTYDVKVLGRTNYFEIWWQGLLKWSGTDASPPANPIKGSIEFSEVASGCSLTLDNVRLRDPNRTSGNYTSIKRGASSGNVATQLRFLGTADAYDATDLWINSSSDNNTWGGWHLVKTMAAPGLYYPIPDIDHKRYYQVRAVLRTGVDGTPSVQEIDVSENPPPTGIAATTNTGHEPWYLYVGGDVNAVSGDLVLSSTDLTIKAKGYPIWIVRTYNSVLAGTAGPFGLGTMDAFHARLAFPTGGNVSLTAGDGAAYTFVTMGGNAYSPPVGLHDNLVKNGDGTYTVWQPDGSRMNFDTTGRVTTIVNRNGNHLTLTYTGGNPTQVADDSGLSLSLTYDAGNRVKTVTDPMGRKVTYTYDGSGRLIQITDPMGFTENNSYDASNRLLQRVDPAGHVDRFVYDAGGRVNETWIGEWNFVPGSVRWQVRQYRIVYVSGTQTTATNAAGAVTTGTFNSQGNPTSVIGPPVGCALCRGGNSTTYTWDGEFNALTVADGRGDTTSRSYDWMGNVLSTRDPEGNTSVQTFTNAQNTTAFIALLASTTNPRGYTTRYTYTANGNLYATMRSGGNTSYRFYDAAGSLTRFQDFRGNSVTYGYDAHEFLVNSTDVGGNKTLYQNDAIGRMWNATTPGGNTTRQVYDPDGRVTSVADPLGNTITSTYDKRGDLLTRKDANLLITQYTYNLTLGGVQQVVDTGGNITKSVYDDLGERIQSIDANGHVTKYGFDNFGRLINTTTPLGHVTRFVYDAAGNDVVEIKANGTRINYTYDASNRLIKTTYPNGQAVSVTYDKNGNVVEKKGLELDEIFAYDALDRVMQTKQIFLDASLTLYHNYTYDANGNRLTMDGSGGGTYVWDKNNHIASQTDAVGSRWTFVYGKDGRLLKEIYPNGGYVTYAYDAVGRTTKMLTYQVGGSLFESATYTYDKVGNRLTDTDFGTSQQTAWSQTGCCTIDTSGLTVSGLSPSPQSVTVYVAPTLILDATQFTPPCPSATVTWYYILNGVKTQIATGGVLAGDTHACYKKVTPAKSATVSLKNGDVLQGEVTYENDTIVATTPTALTTWFESSQAATTYTYDRNYRLGSVTYSPGTTGAYAYDAVGNRLTYASGGSPISSSYNADNELTSSSDGTTYTYDANGNLISRTAGSTTTNYSYDYANDLAPISTTMLISSSCSGCATTANVTLPTLLPSPQSKTVAVGASGTLEDDIDYPNCPTVTVTWYYILNGLQHQVGSNTFTLKAKLGVCVTGFSGTYPSASPVALYTGNRLAGAIVMDPGASSAYVAQSSTSVNAGTFKVAPYVVMQYGPDGLRSSELVNQGSVTQHFGYDLLGMGGLPQEVADYSGTSLTTSYFYGVGSDRPLDVIQGGTSYYYHRDDLGSTTTITDSSGNVAASYRYDAYGNLQQSADTIGNPLRYTGAPFDSTTGLTYDRARFYDPATGRFLTPDPLGGGYAYAGDNPVNRVDPSGRAALNSHLIEGGDGGQGCTMTLYLADRCASIWASIGGGGRGIGGGGPGYSSQGFSWNRCSVPIALFLVGILLGAMGLDLDLFPEGTVALARVLATADSFIVDAMGILNNPGDPGSWITALFDMGWWLWWHALVPLLAWWVLGLASFEVALHFTPPGIAITLLGLALGAVLGFVDLATQGCWP